MICSSDGIGIFARCVVGNSGVFVVGWAAGVIRIVLFTNLCGVLIGLILCGPFGRIAGVFFMASILSLPSCCSTSRSAFAVAAALVAAATFSEALVFAPNTLCHQVYAAGVFACILLFASLICSVVLGPALPGAAVPGPPLEGLPLAGPPLPGPPLPGPPLPGPPLPRSSTRLLAASPIALGKGISRHPIISVTSGKGSNRQLLLLLRVSHVFIAGFGLLRVFLSGPGTGVDMIGPIRTGIPISGELQYHTK